MKHNIHIARAAGVAVILALILTAGLPSLSGAVSAAAAAPTGLTATVSAGGQINLHWSYSSSGESGFQIDRATDTGFVNFMVSFRVPAGVTSFTDNTVAAQTTYYYRVSALTAGGNSPFSNTATATTPAVLGFPQGPVDLIGTALSASKVSLTWKSRSDNEEGFKIERAADELFTQDLKTFQVKAGTVSFTDTTAEPQQTYYYRVVAWNAAGDSPPSNTVSLTTLTAVPQAPNNLAVQYLDNRQVRLTWTDNSGNETGFQVERATDTDFTRNLTIFTVAAHAGSNLPVTVTDRQSPAGTFYYRVNAYNDTGGSDYSNIARATVYDQPNNDILLFGSETANISHPGFDLLTPAVTINHQGQVSGSISLTSTDGKASLQIAGGSQLFNVNAHPLTTLTYNEPDILPQPPEGKTLVEAYDFGPNGATFSYNATVTLQYDTADLPQTITYNDLSLVSWNGTDWQNLTVTQVNSFQHIITTSIAHTGLLAIICPTPDLTAQFGISNLYIYPQSAVEGNSVYVSVMVTNTGYTSGYCDVVLKLNGAKEASQQVSLDVGAHTQVSFTCAGLTASNYALDINGTRGSFVVRAAPAASSSPAATGAPASPPPVSYTPVVPHSQPAQIPVLVIILGAVLLVVLVLIFFLIRR